MFVLGGQILFDLAFVLNCLLYLLGVELLFALNFFDLLLAFTGVFEFLSGGKFLLLDVKFDQFADIGLSVDLKISQFLLKLRKPILNKLYLFVNRLSLSLELSLLLDDVIMPSSDFFTLLVRLIDGHASELKVFLHTVQAFELLLKLAHLRLVVILVVI